ncbi:leucine-rich repeat-containing protein 70-like [Chironomus tepperi]|uniref:leucine-rich repeat-containing protein 70-like n=1 Tax=Chironomus tepperi TaxID=113505 RepID=UPI00391F87CE
MAVLCEFSKLSLPHGDQFYCCEVKNQIIPNNKEVKLIESFQNVKINNDVIGVKFSNCTITKIPSGPTKTFPNLKILIMTGSKIKKITKTDLAEYKNLEIIICDENDIESLPGDLFEGFWNLKFISFAMNKLNDIEPNLLDGLSDLKHVNFKNNPKFNKIYSIYAVYNPNATLDDVRNQIFEKYYGNIENVKKMMENYEQHIQNLGHNSTISDADYYKLINKLQTGIFGDLEAYILNESTKDFNVIINDRVYPVHKFLLAARSPTLAEVLKANPKVENLKLLDIPAVIFEVILKFLYTDELPGGNGIDFLDLFSTAVKLKIQELKNYAAERISSQLNEDNAFEILNQSIKHKMHDIKDKAYKMIKKKYPNFVVKDDLSLDPEKLYKFIQNFKMKEEAKRKYEDEIRKLDEQFGSSTMTD